MAHIAEIGPQREHEEQSAQHVAPLGEPGHRFDPLRMDGEQRGHEGAGPKLAGHLPPDQKQCDRRGGVQQQIGQMVPPGVQPEHLAIEHVRNHRQRIPLAHRAAGQRPLQSVGRQAVIDVRVVSDIQAVVVFEEGVPQRLAVDRRDDEQQKRADGPNRTLVLGWGAISGRLHSNSLAEQARSRHETGPPMCTAGPVQDRWRGRWGAAIPHPLQSIIFATAAAVFNRAGA